MNDNIETISDAVLSIDWEAESRHLRSENAILVDEIGKLRRQVAYLEGMVSGLKFAMRCNGVSGGEIPND